MDLLASLKRVYWSCIACRRLHHGTQWAADMQECRHVGTILEKPFWRASGEPNAAMKLDDKSRKEYAHNVDEKLSRLKEKA